MKNLTILLLSIIATGALAQNARPLTVVDAERAFARKAKETSVRQAFLAYMDSASLIVDRTNTIRPGQPLYQAAPESPGYLRWAPEFAASSADGLFGFTTGPYDFRANHTTDTILDQGEFATVWRRTPTGDWKFVIDMGTPYQLTNEMPSRQEVLPPAASVGGKTGATFLQAEQDFIRQFAKSKSRAYRSNLAERYRLLRMGGYPVRPESVGYAFFDQQADLSFEITGHAAAPSGDLAVVYGYVMPQTSDGPAQKNAYLRVWRKEGKRWKLVLEVLRV